MKVNILSVFVLALVLSLLASCGHQEERFNYTLVKSKLSLTEEQTRQFDLIKDEYSTKARAAYEASKPDRQKVKEAVGEVFAQQDAAMQDILSPEQFDIYVAEMKIERDGREKHNMQLIKSELALDSAQSVQYDLANEAFYKTLIDNHDNYHGKPDVYLQYYQELDLSRRQAFEGFMSPAQYTQYVELATEYNIGKSEH
ncbi:MULTISPECIES: hypothetical protein [Reichenbachiella]|uniref:Lipoprotein n=1 Tax=Reichenbachiella agariperforans TaxID=156994 RepID=A0A1M6VJM7_REIAG|nr:MULTISPECIES: hypothetical protein [Reichenbachiella]RJE75306.1 hypothetical protein BGP76_19635 [Reichenbachiella sp. MSK19-1]SHK81723.1 hypothetical protein SAMN04488028_10981 [Reichenbachiella agariperforans]